MNPGFGCFFLSERYPRRPEDGILGHSTQLLKIKAEDTDLYEYCDTVPIF